MNHNTTQEKKMKIQQTNNNEEYQRVSSGNARIRFGIANRQTIQRDNSRSVEVGRRRVNPINPHWEQNAQI